MKMVHQGLEEDVDMGKALRKKTNFQALTMQIIDLNQQEFFFSIRAATVAAF